MGPLLESLGFARIPMLFSLGLVIVLGLWSAWRLFRPGASADSRTKILLDASFFWGFFAAIIGAMGAVVGVIGILQAIEMAGGVMVTPQVAGALRAATLTPLVGLLVLGFAAILWFVLQLRWRLLQASVTEAGA